MAGIASCRESGRLKRLLSQLPGRFWAPRSMVPSGSMMPGQPMPMNGASRRPSFAARLIRPLQHLDELLDRFFALDVLLVGVPPELELPDEGLGKVGCLLEVERDHAGAEVGAADVHRQDRVVRLEHPPRRQMRGADQAGFVRIVADRHQVDRDLVGLEDHRRAADGELADPAGAEAAADHDPFGVAPGLELEKAPDDEGELLRKILDRALQDAGRLRIAFDQQRVELLLADVLARLVAEGVVSGLAQRLAPVLDDVAERAPCWRGRR